MTRGRTTVKTQRRTLKGCLHQPLPADSSDAEAHELLVIVGSVCSRFHVLVFTRNAEGGNLKLASLFAIKVIKEDPRHFTQGLYDAVT